MKSGMRWPSENAVLGTTARIVDTTLPTSRKESAPTISVQRDGSAPKYGNVKTDGEASGRQAKRLTQLRLMNEAGQIRGLCRQPEFVLIPKQFRECGVLIERKMTYIADFLYQEWTADGWRLVVEDSKGFATPGYVAKRKLMLRIHGIEVREV